MEGEFGLKKLNRQYQFTITSGIGPVKSTRRERGRIRLKIKIRNHFN